MEQERLSYRDRMKVEKMSREEKPGSPKGNRTGQLPSCWESESKSYL